LKPENIVEAVAATGARIVDVNSGIESVPGVKDHARLQAFAAALRQIPVSS
jgi:phosphoribosylanthranilate isomerase